jgi:class 3 adenylate cyclase
VTEVLSSPSEGLAEARAAFARHDWHRAYELLSEVDETESLGPDELLMLGESAWWLAQLGEAIRIRERAYAALLRAGRKTEAAALALALVMDYGAKLKHKLAEAALRRAERLLAEESEGPVHATLAIIHALGALEMGDLDAAGESALRAQELGAAHGSRDDESFGLILQGRVLIAQGEVDRGLELVDEATAAAVSGELGAVSTGILYCITIDACTQLADFDRASEWTEAAELWCEQEQIQTGFPGVCRVHRAEIKRFRGAWVEAEREALRAAEELMNFAEDMAGSAYYEAGEVRLHQGELDGAEEAFGKAHELFREPEPGMSLLLLARGDVTAAAASIRRSLENPKMSPLDRARRLPAQVEIALAGGDLDTARAAVDEMEGIAEQYRSPSPVFRAHAACARAALALAEGEPQRALECLNSALADWKAVRAPYEAARTRVEMARAYEAMGDVQAARLERESALSAFQRLGAARDVAALTGPETVVRTFMFTDVVRSTELMRHIGDETWAGLLNTHDRVLRELFARHRGEEVDHAGDGFFVAFAQAGDALDCATAIQRTVSDPVRFGELQVRIGVHTATAARDGDAYRGQGVHVAARVAALADGGEILVSRAAAEAAGHNGDLQMRAMHLKGIDDPVEVGALDWAA